MAEHSDLQKRLRSIRTARQLAGAMKTVSAAKFARAGAHRSAYAPYAAACTEMLTRFCTEFSAVLPCKDPSAPPCLVVVGGNRGLCGGFNAELIAFALEKLDAIPEKKVFVVGKAIENAFSEKRVPFDGAFTLPDVPAFDDCRPLIERLRNAYTEGEVSSVELLYPKFVNTLVQTPLAVRILPFAGSAAPVGEDGAGLPAADGTLFVPDRESVLRAACLAAVDARIFSLLSEAAAGAQAATLTAMRSAYDNAVASADKLETAIHRARQAQVTADVIETASDHGEN